MSPARPQPDEYAPYYGLYVDQAPQGDVLEILAEELATTVRVLGSLGEREETFRYAPAKWTLREIVGHLIDTEWTFAYRALCFARGEPSPLPDFDQELWARFSSAGSLPMAELLDVLAGVRLASLATFRGFAEEEWLRHGVAAGCRFTVRSIPYILAGHEIHHRKVIDQHYR